MAFEHLSRETKRLRHRAFGHAIAEILIHHIDSTAWNAACDGTIQGLARPQRLLGAGTFQSCPGTLGSLLKERDLLFAPLPYAAVKDAESGNPVSIFDHGSTQACQNAEFHECGPGLFSYIR